ncbi:MAG: M15 family metallopeptidase [Erysipelotrichaceae bacterium]|nr:M15 family metallopeptidase [Erysipelotrichaceae bacterium]
MPNIRKTLANGLDKLAKMETEFEERNKRKPKKKKKKKGLRLKKSVIAIAVAVIVMIVGILVVPKIMTDNKLKELGYNKEDIAAIREMNLQSTLIKEGYYSPYLAASIKDKSVKLDYLPLYIVRTSDNPLEELDFLMYNRLVDRGYTPENARVLLKELKTWELTPLLVYDLQSDPQPYIEDCKNHRDTNSINHFELSGNYYSVYENTIAADESNINMLVNKTYHLTETYTPPEVVEVSVQFAATGVQLAKEAADALAAFGTKGQELGLRFYAASGYRDYYRQDSLYTSYIGSMGQEQADALSARPGFSEHQTGLTIDLAAIMAEGISEFKDTQEYSWTKDNCMTYGFILRYPEGKSQITGYDFEPWHYRYLGTDLAQRVYDSGLTYDEFYQLYLQPWNYAENIYAYPGCTSAVRETPVVFAVEQPIEEGTTAEETTPEVEKEDDPTPKG